MTAHKSGDPTTLNRLYGRQSGHKLRAGQQQLVDALLPALSVPEEGEVTAANLFGYDRPLHFEIGFGGGEHLAYRADLLPDHGFIGCEPFLNGVVTALADEASRRDWTTGSASPSSADTASRAWATSASIWATRFRSSRAFPMAA